MPKMPELLKIPKITKIPRIPRIPIISGIPLRTKLLFVGITVLCVIAVPMILSLGSDDGEGAEQVEVMAEAGGEIPGEPGVEEIIEDWPAEPSEEEAVEEPPAEPAEESSEEFAAEPAAEEIAEQAIEEVSTEPLENEDQADPPAPAIDPNVGGVLSEDTTWGKTNGSYVITETVRVLPGVRLTIEPGVTIIKPTSGDMFLLNGTIYAHGTAQEPIVFDGGGNSNFFNPRNSDADAFLDLEHCEIANGISLWPLTHKQQLGAFSLRNSQVANLSGFSYVAYPREDIMIEHNTFTNAAGFSLGHTGTVRVYVQYNTFNGKHPNLAASTDYWIQNWGSFNESETIVRYNGFDPEDGIALRLAEGYQTAAITATENYWGTPDKGVIEAMIYDRNDGSACEGYIDYEPVLSGPHPGPDLRQGP